MKIQIPKVLDLSSTLNFCNIIDSLKEDTHYIYDYKNMSTVEPFGMLLIGSKIRRFIDLKEDCDHSDCNFETSQYAAHMGFFQSVYQDFGKKPGEAKGSDTYIPITQLEFDKVREKIKKDGINIYEYIESTSEKLAYILARNDTNLRHCLKYSIRELIRNVLEHSQSKSLWYAGQYWPSKNMVEVAILDEGIGIKNSFKKNSKILVKEDEDAIKLALQAGISKSGIGKVGGDHYDNCGFGLYMISNICKEGGDIAICSGSKCLLINSNRTSIYETSFGGTAIRLRLKPSELGRISEIMSELSRLGSKKAKEFKMMQEISVDSIENV